MTPEKIREMVVDIISQADYDLGKSFDPECSEDFEAASEVLERIVKNVQQHYFSSKTPSFVVPDFNMWSDEDLRVEWRDLDESAGRSKLRCSSEWSDKIWTEMKRRGL